MRGLLAPFISLLFNRSFTTGCFPLEVKEAVIRTRLKESGLDASELKNYRLVSILSFLFKLFEKTAQVRIQIFFDRNRLMPKMQAAYWRHHSTDTAVTKVFKDLLLAADGGQMSALCLLSIMDYCYTGLNVSSVCVASCWCSDPVCLAFTDRSVLCSAAVVFHHLHYLLCPAKFYGGSTAVYYLHSGP